MKSVFGEDSAKIAFQLVNGGLDKVGYYKLLKSKDVPEATIMSHLQNVAFSLGKPEIDPWNDTAMSRVYYNGFMFGVHMKYNPDKKEWVHNGMFDVESAGIDLTMESVLKKRSRMGNVTGTFRIPEIVFRYAQAYAQSYEPGTDQETDQEMENILYTTRTTQFLESVFGENYIEICQQLMRGRLDKLGYYKLLHSKGVPEEVIVKQLRNIVMVKSPEIVDYMWYARIEVFYNGTLFTVDLSDNDKKGQWGVNKNMSGLVEDAQGRFEFPVTNDNIDCDEREGCFFELPDIVKDHAIQNAPSPEDMTEAQEELFAHNRAFAASNPETMGKLEAGVKEALAQLQEKKGV